MAIYRKSGTRSGHQSKRLKSRLVFDQLNPVVCFTYYVITIAMSMVFIHPIFLMGEFIIIMLVNILAQNYKQTLGMLQGSLFMMVFILIMNPLINNRGAHVIAVFGGITITAESIVYGFLMALSLSILMLVFVSYNKTITSHKFLYLFSKVSPQLALLTMITMRFVPLFIKRFANIRDVQRTRGIQMETGSLKRRSDSGMRLMEVLLVSSFEDALQTADSMNARGYGVHKRSNYEQYRFTKRDGLALVALVVPSIVCFVAASNGVGRLVIYPVLGSFMLNSISWMVFLLVILVFSFPLILEGWEYIWWSFLK